MITRRLVDAGTLLGIQVLDHLVMTNDRHTSMATTGQLVQSRRTF